MTDRRQVRMSLFGQLGILTQQLYAQFLQETESPLLLRQQSIILRTQITFVKNHFWKVKL